MKIKLQVLCPLSEYLSRFKQDSGNDQVGLDASGKCVHKLQHRVEFREEGNVSGLESYSTSRNLGEVLIYMTMKYLSHHLDDRDVPD